MNSNLFNRQILCMAVLGMVCVLGSAAMAGEFRPVVGEAVRFDISPPLSELALTPRPVNRKQEAGAIREGPDFGRSEADAEPDGGLQLQARLPGALSNTPAPLVSVQGLTEDDNSALVGIEVVPPDSSGDIGLNELGERIYMQTVNVVWSVFDARDGSRLHGPFANNVFWTGFDGPCEHNNDGDAVVLYDHLAGRWVFSQFSIDEGTQCLAVSTTSDPVGTYYRYAFVVTPGGENDYPKLGVWSDGAGQSAYTLTTRDFGGDGGPFSMGSIVLERDAILSGQPASFVKFINSCVANDCLEGQLPAHIEGPPPPAGTCPTFWSAVDAAFDNSPHASDGYRNHTLCVDWSDRGSSTYVEGPLVPAGSNFDRFLGGGLGDCIGPVKDSEDLDCLARFTMYRAQYRWFGTHASVVLNTTVDAGGDRAGIRWAEVHSADGDSAWFRQQDGTYAPGDGLERWMGSIAQDGSGNIALGYSVAGANLFPSIRYTSRAADDPPGTLGGGEVSCHEGTGGQTSGLSRWGDYSSMSVDPVDQCTFWYTQEYKEVTSGYDFDTWICSFRLDNCSAAVVENPFYIANQIALPDTLSPGFGDLHFSDDGNTAYIIDRSNVSGAAIWSAPVIRSGVLNEVTGFGAFTEVFSYFRADTGLVFGPGSDTFVFRYRFNSSLGVINQRLASGVIEQTPIIGYDGSNGGLAFVPGAYTQGGQLLSVSYVEGKIFLHDVADDGDGSFTISGAPSLTVADLSASIGPGGLGDIEYITQGPLSGSLLAAVYNRPEEIIYMPVDPVTGLPDDTAVSTLASGFQGDAWGLAVDPVTGNIWRLGYNTGLLTQITFHTCGYAVTRPNGGQAWNINSVQVIRWQTGGTLCGSQVRIELFASGVFQATLAASTPNDGAFTWVVGGVPPGSDYTIRVTDLGDANYRDDSDAPFSVVDLPGFIFSSSFD